MYLKKNATVLISTVIMLSLMSLLGCFIYKMIKNNSELSNLYNFHKDIYDFDESEEEVLNKFMKDLNKYRKKSNEENSIEEDPFLNDFESNIEDSTLKYSKNKDKLLLITSKDAETNRKREIKYFFRDEKIVLVPTYKFKNEEE